MDKEIDIDVDEDGILQNGVVEGAVGSRSTSELSKSVENLTTEQRLKRKAKRVVRQLSKEGVPNGTQVVNVTRHWKNTRRPRNGKGRGLPKKGLFCLFFVYYINLAVLYFEQYLNYFVDLVFRI